MNTELLNAFNEKAKREKENEVRRRYIAAQQSATMPYHVQIDCNPASRTYGENISPWKR